MGLQLSKELDSGVVGDYYKIENIFMRDNQTRCLVSFYKDQAARDAGKESLTKLDFNFEGGDELQVVDMDLVNSNPYTLVYEKLKLLPEFSGALDV